MERRDPQSDPCYYIRSSWTPHTTRVHTNSMNNGNGDYDVVVTETDGAAPGSATTTTTTAMEAASGGSLGENDHGSEEENLEGFEGRKRKLEDSDEEFAAGVANAISNTAKRSTKATVEHQDDDDQFSMHHSRRSKKSKKKKRKKHRRHSRTAEMSIAAPPATTSTTADLIASRPSTIYSTHTTPTLSLPTQYWGVDPYMMVAFPSRTGSRGLSFFRSAGVTTTESALLAPYLTHHASMLPAQQLLQQQQQQQQRQQQLLLQQQQQQQQQQHERFEDSNEHINDGRGDGVIGGRVGGSSGPNDGGIFDDADDDNTFEVPTRYPALNRVPRHTPGNHMSATAARSLQNIARIVRREQDDSISFDSPQQSKTANTLLSANSDSDDNGGARFDDAAVVEQDGISIAGYDNSYLGKRKKPSKPTRRVLFSKKEQDAAEALLKGKIDLLRILPEEDCRFLGENLWVFTLQQLECILNHTDQKERQRNGSVVDDTVGDNAVGDSNSSSNEPSETQRNLRRELLEKLAASNLLRRGEIKHAARAKHESWCENSTSVAEKSKEDVESEMNNVTRQGSGSISQPDEMVKSETGTDVASGTTSNDVIAHPVSSSTGTGTGEVGEPVAVSLHLATKPDMLKSPKPEMAESMGRSTDDRTPLSTPPMELDEEKQTKQSSTDLLHDAEFLEAAEKKLSSWKQAITRWYTENQNSDDVDQNNQFPLNGPLSCLFPICAQRFVASVPLKYARDFLVLKKTETGVIIDMLRLWRQKCNLSNASNLPLAKHLLSIHMRIEAGIGSVPHAHSDLREWMGGQLVVLTGAAKDFVVTGRRIFSAAEFIEQRTKELSSELIEWRIEKGLPPLKGTGNVAMISGWKALVKEAIDVETGDGSVLSGIDFEKEVQDENFCARDEKKPKQSKSHDEKKTSKTLEKFRGPAVEEALNSPDFLSSVFKEKRLKIFLSVGIKTAKDLLDADKNPSSPLVKAVVATRKGSDESPVRPESCVRLVYEWCQRVNKKLDHIEQKMRSQPNTSGKAPTTHDSKSSPSRTTGKNKTPFESLSASTRSFLSSIGITSSEDFLSARTTDIANEFILWRQQRDMPQLKGLGAIASVSGWKALVRKAANSAGMEDIATLAPKSILTETKQPRKVLASKKSHNRETTDSGVLFGMSRRRFAVRKDAGGLPYIFELSVRGPKRSKPSLYLTYLGCGKLATRKSAETRSTVSVQTKRPSKIPILEDIPVKALASNDNAPFSSSLPGCGTIELGKYGVHPFPQKGTYNGNTLTHNVNISDDLLSLEKERYDALKKAVKIFVSFSRSTAASASNTVASEVNKSPSMEISPNVVEHVGKSGENKYFLCIEDLMEKGQTVELTFKNLEAPIYSEDEDCDTRRWLRQQISQLPPNHLNDLLEYVRSSIGSSVDRKLSRIVKKSSLSSGDDDSLTPSTAYVRGVLIARRRIHWVALRIGEQLGDDLEKESGETDESPLWTPLVANKILSLCDWNADFIRKTLKQEVELEVAAEFSSARFGDFSSTRNVWCPMAERLYLDSFEVFSRFLTELDTYCSEEILVDELCSLVTNAVLKVDALAEDMSLEAKKLSDLVLTYGPGTVHSSRALPLLDEVAKTSTYSRSSHSDEIQLEPSHSQHFRVVATTKSDTKGDSREDTEDPPVSMQSVEEINLRLQGLDRKWYIERQIIAVSQTVSICCLHQLTMKAQYRQLSDIASKLLGAARLAGRDRSLQSVELQSQARLRSVALPRSAQKFSAKCQPSSSQFFLGLIWPVLSSAGWKLEVGSSPSSVMFLPPGRKKNAGKYAHHVKQKAAKERNNLALRTNDLGLSYIPKRTKRLFANASAVRENGKMSGQMGPTVKDALDRYLRSIRADLPDDDKPSRKRARKVVEQMCYCFDELAPRLHFEEEEDFGRIDVGQQRPCEVYNCEYLMRLLLVMPSMLRQSDLPMRQVDDTLGVIRELTDFLSINHDEFFEESLHVPLEHYDGETSVPAFLAPRLLRRSASKSNHQSRDDCDDSPDVVQSTDKSGLTDFIGFVLSQVVICRATSDDVSRKNRRIPLGFPGLVCRHCMGEGGEGKYFFSSIESLTTAGTVVEKHIAKCPKIDQQVKAEMIQCRSRHGEQRKNLPQGGQAAFFSRLWDRLMSAKVPSGASGDVYVSVSKPASTSLSSGSETTESSEQYDFEGTDSNSVAPSRFKNHIVLMDYLQTTSPWAEKPELAKAIEKYYNCIEYGGRVYNTKEMPVHFNSEWILSKVAWQGNTTQA